jgi:hypothetical protein
VRRLPKRSVPTKTYLRPEIREQLELFAARSSNIITLSEYLAEMCEQHVIEKQVAIEISKQKIGRRFGNQ